MSDDADKTAREIVCEWAGTNRSDQPLEDLILAIGAVLRGNARRIKHHRTDIVEPAERLVDLLQGQDDAEKQARELADHCRYCGMPDYRPKCKADYEIQVKAIAAALREKDAELEQAAERQREMRAIGGLMANLCFNGKQDEEVPLSYREDMRKLQKEWDAILAQAEVKK